MSTGELELSFGGSREPSSGEQPSAYSAELETMRTFLAEGLGVSSEVVTDEDIAYVYVEGGFADWDPEQSRAIRDALASRPGFEHL